MTIREFDRVKFKKDFIYTCYKVPPELRPKYLFLSFEQVKEVVPPTNLLVKAEEQGVVVDYLENVSHLTVELDNSIADGDRREYLVSLSLVEAREYLEVTQPVNVA